MLNMHAKKLFRIKIFTQHLFCLSVCCGFIPKHNLRQYHKGYRLVPVHTHQWWAVRASKAFSAGLTTIRVIDLPSTIYKSNYSHYPILYILQLFYQLYCFQQYIFMLELLSNHISAIMCCLDKKRAVLRPSE